MLSIAGETGHAQPADVLKHQRLWFEVPNLLNCPCEEIAFILCAELLTSNAEWGAWNPTGEQIYPYEIRRLQNFCIGYVSQFHDRIWLKGTFDLQIERKGPVSVLVEFNCAAMVETCELKPEGLPPCTCADLNNFQICHSRPPFTTEVALFADVIICDIFSHEGLRPARRLEAAKACPKFQPSIPERRRGPSAITRSH